MSLLITRAGLFDTIQDGGRKGFRYAGVGPSGMMDTKSGYTANALLGKDLNSALLELHFPAASIMFEAGTIISITGADFQPVIGAQRLPLNQAISIPKGSLLQFKRPVNGRCCYLASLHEWELQPWLGSCSTQVRIGVGGLNGNKLLTGDRIQFRPLRLTLPSSVSEFPWKGKQMEQRETIRFIKGPEWEWLSDPSLLEQNTFRVSTQSDRMGFRLDGMLLKMKIDEQLVSSPVCAGTMQLLPNGQIIVLMADHQTTGGYPRIGQVISADMPFLSQSITGMNKRFSLTDVATAEQEWLDQQEKLEALKNASKFNLQNTVHAFM